MSRKRIGIYSGTFDPVHTGHIAFALQALEQANLDLVYFLPERRPRNKVQVEHFAHRSAMLKQAIRPHPHFKVLELVDVSFTVERTLPKLQTLFRGDQLVFLFGSEVIPYIDTWPKASRLLNSSELFIALKSNHSEKIVRDLINTWSVQPKEIGYIDSYAPSVSSHKIREALRTNHRVAGILKSVERYSNKNWLYVSLGIDKP
jgi:nicotinate (nicotinamide) nucleotide adenylyltransferase